MTLLLVWHETLKSVFVIVFTVFDVIMTWLIDRLDSFLYYQFWKTTIGQFRKTTDGQTTTQKLDSTIKRRSKKITYWSWTRNTECTSRSWGVFHVPFKIHKKKLRNPGPLDRSDQAPKKTKNWACIMWILLTCHFPRDIKGLHNAFTRYRTPLTWLEIKLFKT